MNEILTANVVRDIEPLPIGGSENWSEDFMIKEKHSAGLLDIARAGVMLVTLTVSSLPYTDAAAMSMLQDSATIVGIGDGQVIKQRISLKEARQLALAILERAEKKRAVFAEQEARVITVLETD